jgi:hypothetical protein
LLNGNTNNYTNDNAIQSRSIVILIITLMTMQYKVAQIIIIITLMTMQYKVAQLLY